MTQLTVRAVRPADEPRWRELFRGYREFYRLTPDEAVVDTVWGWINEPSHPVRGLVAELEGNIVAIANYRSFPRPSTGTIGLFLDDLFSDPERRKTGAATALLRELARIASDEGASVVRWITADDNATARSVYDREANLTRWATYDMSPAPAD